MKDVVLIGDSIRMGYQDSVRRELEGEARVWTPDQNGGTSADVLDHLDEWVLARGADVVHLNCGLHDLKKSFESGDPEIPPEQYSANIRAVFDGVREAATSTLIWARVVKVYRSAGSVDEATVFRGVRWVILRSLLPCFYSDLDDSS